MGPWYKNAWKLISRPYVFFEEAIDQNQLFPATMVFLVSLGLTFLGWLLAGAGKDPVSQAVINWLVSLLTYPVSVLIIFLTCRLLVRENRLRAFFAVWGFSYLPTLLFFLVNISAHFLRKFPWFFKVLTHPLVVLGLWMFLCLMLLWKLLYLLITLRLAGNLNLRQICWALLFLAVVTAAYWWMTLSMGWLKVPFI
jgi:hypothetical protein